MKKYLIILLFILLSILLHYSHSFAARKALLIGVENYKNLPATLNGRRLSNLKGPENDVKLMKKRLISYYGFLEDEIKVLMSNNATRENIETDFNNWLVKGTKNGDLVVFYFSGHGSTVPDYNGDEDDEKDEVLLTYDMDPNGGYNIIVDDELGMWLEKLNGRTAVVMVDSCYSGGVVRGIGEEIKSLDETPARMEKYVPIVNYKPSSAVRGISKGVPDVPNSVIFMSASRENEVALEIIMPEGFQGGFTFGLSEGMKNLRNVSYDRLFEYAKKTVKDKLQLPQEPQIQPKGILTAMEAFSSVGGYQLSEPLTQEQSYQTGETPSWIKGTDVLLRFDKIYGINASATEKIKRRLVELPYVYITKDVFFDRMIKGEFKSGRYNIQLLNRIGDTEVIKPARDIKELIDLIRPHLEYALMVKQLAHISPSNPAFKVEIETDDRRRDYRLGEEITFNVYSEKDCYLLILDIHSEGDIHIIFPNKRYKDNRVSGGKTINIPDEVMKKENFRFIFDAPAGEETVKVIASTRSLKLEDIGLAEFEKYFDLAGLISVPADKKGSFIENVSKTLYSNEFEWSEDSIVIRSHY